ncbi:MAG: hypothetical protein Q7S36_03445 [Candidatus Liptonbacteria bacterium]|nr:hypothetical protein [Candidatus Liptonbacteria bacterium]
MTFAFIAELVGNFLASYWWAIVPVFFVPAFISLYTFVNHEKMKRANTWSLLDIKVSREIKKTPQAMESILATINGWGTRPFRKPVEWTSLELVSIGGEIHFFIRIQEKFKTLLESTFFSFYQDVEIKEVADYVERIPSNTAELYARDLDVWGTELVLEKEGAYPIKSYKELTGGGEGKEFDPLSIFLEIMGRIDKDELLGVQMILMPVKTKDIRTKYKFLIDGLKGKSKSTASGGLANLIPPADFLYPKAPSKEASAKPAVKERSEGDAEKLKAVEDNLSKPMFNTLIRIIYLSPKTIFRDRYAKQGIVSSFNQYAVLNLNSFKRNDDVGVGEAGDKWPFVFSKKRDEARKERILHTYRHRDVPPATFLGKFISSMPFHHNIGSKYCELSVESLATIYHLPTTVSLTAPYMNRVESRKVGPPLGLAIYGEDKDLEIFE